MGSSPRKITAQSIHFEKPPPTQNTVPPSRRSAMPALSRQTKAAGPARSSNTRMMSYKNGGIAFVPVSVSESAGCADHPHLNDTLVVPPCPYEIPPPPWVIQNSSSRVTPDTARHPRAVTTYRIAPRPEI